MPFDNNQALMLTNGKQDQLQVTHVHAPDSVREAFRKFGTETTDPPKLADGESVSEAVAVHAANQLLCVVGLERKNLPVSPFRVKVRTLSLTPFWIFREPNAGEPESRLIRNVIHLVLREVFFGGKDWHVVRCEVPTENEEIVDVAWRYAINLGFSCTITQHPPPSLLNTGELRVRAPTLTIYSPRFKGNLARIAAGGMADSARAVLRERRTALMGSVRRLNPSRRAAGSRLFVLDLATASEDDLPGGNVTFAEIPEEEVIRDPLAFGTSVRRVEQALRRGDRCFAVFVEGVMAHHKWASVNPDFLRSLIPSHGLRRATAYPFDSYTHPQFRGRGFQGTSALWLAIQYRREGIEQFVTRISAHNTASIRGILKAGYTELEPES